MDDIEFDNIRKLNGGLLLVFRELMRRGRTTAVADRLGLSQSAVSHALGRLRDVFEDPLFVRRPHGLEPTPRALALAPRVEALIDLTSAAVRRKSGFDPAESERRFNLAIPEYLTVILGTALLRRFGKFAPGASFSAEMLMEQRALEALARGEVDLAIGRFGAPPPGVAIEPLYDDEYCVVARKAHPTLKARISEAAYRRIGHVFSGTTATVSATEGVPDTREVATVAVVPTWLSALALVARTDAIATVPRRLAEAQAPLLGLKILKPPFAMWPIHIALARRRDDGDPGIAWFLEQIRIVAAS